MRQRLGGIGDRLIARAASSRSAPKPILLRAYEQDQRQELQRTLKFLRGVLTKLVEIVDEAD